MCAVCIVSESVQLCFRGQQTVVSDLTSKGEYKWPLEPIFEQLKGPVIENHS